MSKRLVVIDATWRKSLRLLLEHPALVVADALHVGLSRLRSRARYGEDLREYVILGARASIRLARKSDR